MGDFSQNGAITTLHDFGRRSSEDLEADLTRWGRTRPMSLVIPSLYSELERPALSRIVDEIAQIPFLDQVIIGLDQAPHPDQLQHAREFFARLPQPTQILWNDGPRLQALDRVLRDHNVAPTEMGKGRNVWYCLGYFLASGIGQVVGLHDADIVTYERSMVAKLFYPVAHPDFGYVFSKGFYFRTDGERLYGRVVRLLVTPLISALRSALGGNDYLDYLASFRYPLAGEFAMAHDVVADLRIPSDWGLEIGVLSDVHSRYDKRQICQVDLGKQYDHKHQPGSFDDRTKGLHKMSLDVAEAICRSPAVGGEGLTPALVASLGDHYQTSAVEVVGRYEHLAAMNGLGFDRGEELRLVDLFSHSVAEAGASVLANPAESPVVAGWGQVARAVPDVYDRLCEAVAADNG